MTTTTMLLSFLSKVILLNDYCVGYVVPAFLMIVVLLDHNLFPKNSFVWVMS